MIKAQGGIFGSVAASAPLVDSIAAIVNRKTAQFGT
jgi:hypothetical protein